MSWNARLKAALHGEVDGADVRGLLAASTALVGLRQGRDDRALELSIAHPDDSWHVQDELGPLTATLWLAEALVTLAQSLVDGEAAAHPDRASMLSMPSHDDALAVLAPVETMIADLSATLANPARPLAIRLPYGLGVPRGKTNSDLPPAYLRGLLRGVERLEGAAQAAQADLEKQAGVPSGSAPGWLTQGMQSMRGEQAGLAARLEMARVRLAALVQAQAAEAYALGELAGELWTTANAYLRLGQMASAPRLLPNAPPLTPSPSPTGRGGTYAPAGPPIVWQPVPGGNRPDAPDRRPPAPPFAGTPAPPVAIPPPAPVEEPPRALPAIAPTWQHAPDAGDDQRRGSQTPSPAVPEPPARPLPAIGASPASGARGARPDQRKLPQIGEAAATGKAGVEASRGAHWALPKIAAVDTPSPAKDSANQPLPQIGPVSAPPAPAVPRGEAPSSPVPRPAAVGTPGPAPGGRRIERAARWSLSSTVTRHALRARGAEEEAERALDEFWRARQWTLDTGAAAYLDATAALLASGSIVPSGRGMASAPFAPIYRVARGAITLLGRSLPANRLFTYDYGVGRLVEPGPGEGVAD